jgi:hypothetical protein
MAQVDDLSRSLTAFEQSDTLVAVLEMSQSSWLAAGVVPGVERRPLKKLDPDPAALLRLLERWRDQAAKAGREVARVVLAFEAGRDGFWLARWLRARGIEAHVVHPATRTHGAASARDDVWQTVPQCWPSAPSRRRQRSSGLPSRSASGSSAAGRSW